MDRDRTSNYSVCKHSIFEYKQTKDFSSNKKLNFERYRSHGPRGRIALSASHFCLCFDLLVYHTLHIHTTQSSLNSHGNLPLAGWPDANLPLRHNREAQYLVTVTRVVHETECTRVSVADKILPSIFYGRIYV